MKLLVKFAHRQVRSLTRHLKEYNQSPTADTVHKIRVDLKKVKAIFPALHACVKDCHAQKQLHFFQEIFRLAGKIRDAEVLSQLLLQFHVEVLQNAYLSSTLFGTKLHLAIPHFIKKTKKMGNKLEWCSARVNRHDFRKYLRKRKKEIESECFPLPEMSAMHNVRKDIKEVLYLCEVDRSATKKNAFFEKVQDLIGKLNDKQMLLHLLQKHNASVEKIEAEIKSACAADEAALYNLVACFYQKS